MTRSFNLLTGRIKSILSKIFLVLHGLRVDSFKKIIYRHQQSGVPVIPICIFLRMRDIAHADSEEIFKDAVTSLKQSEYWKENEHLRVWFEKQWLSASDVSCPLCLRCYPR